MSYQPNKKSLWQVLGIYLAMSWICLQVVDVLIQNMGLPKWIFSLAIGLLLIGLPITAATAYFQGIGRRTEADPDALAVSSHHRFFKWKNVLLGGIASLAVWGLVVTGWVVLTSRQNADSELNLVSGMDEIRRLAGESDYSRAFAMATELDGLIENDSVRKSMWSLVSQEIVIKSVPPGARVLRRDYESSDDQWEELGVTPLELEHFPRGLSRLRFELEGYLPRETANFSSQLAALPPFVLDTTETLPAGMTRVSGGSASLMVPGLEQLAALTLADFLMDINEVTNREYKTFVDAGGYRDPACWQHPFVLDGEELTFETAVAGFVDQTGRPGPSGWDVGSFPEGEDNLPVGGVSWHEAAAYACFAGKSLPTVYHWYMAANPFSSNHVVPLSNYDGLGPAPAGQYTGISRDGVHDMAGNMREWTQNPDGEAHYILGGGWNDPKYSFNDANTSPSFDRSLENGIRLVMYPDTTNVVAAGGPIEKSTRDYYAETPVSDELFELYRQMYAYDRTPLNATLISTDTSGKYVRERIEMDAAYGGERLTVFVFRPSGDAPASPYQAVTFFPGSNDIYKRSYDELGIRFLDFVLRSGRVLVYPVYKGTYERGSELNSDIQDTSNLYRDHVIAWSRDLGRTIDYLETREDIDSGRLAYLGISWGGVMGAIMTAVEQRFKASVLIVGGLMMQDVQPMVDPYNFLPRVTTPTLMLNGRYDSFFPLDTAIQPFFEKIGTRAADKRIIVTDANHFVLAYDAKLVIAETLNWLDHYLGPVN